MLLLNYIWQLATACESVHLDGGLGQRQIMTSLSEKESVIKELPLKGSSEDEGLIMFKPEIFI